MESSTKPTTNQMLRRMYVQSLIKFANNYEGGPISLVNVREHDDHTDVEFALDALLRTTTPMYNRAIGRILVTVQLPEEDITENLI